MKIEPLTMDNEITIQGIIKRGLKITAVLVGLSVVTLKIELVVGVSIGALLGILNFKILSLTTIRGLSKVINVQRYIMLSFLIRNILIAALFCTILLLFKKFCFIGTIIGFSSIRIAIFLEGARRYFKSLSKKQDTQTC